MSQSHMKQMKEHLKKERNEKDKLFTTPLTDWQKIEAVNSFVISKATYHFNAATFDQSWAVKLDAKLRRLVKKSMRLPTRTISALFHMARRHGGLGLHSLEDNLNVSQITRFLRCLSSPDKNVQNITWATSQQL